eukprot:GFUD01085762.1.p1 GENE.GFUD01085762.1~~GFUD01085762.1.p1  ORF type:complete len:139 (-),score=19.28 GFUD01085762.1:23-439(-)
MVTYKCMSYMSYMSYMDLYGLQSGQLQKKKNINSVCKNGSCMNKARNRFQCGKALSQVYHDADAFFPSFVGRPHHGVMVCMEQKDAYVAIQTLHLKKARMNHSRPDIDEDEAQSKSILTLQHPVEHEPISSWDVISNI